MPIATFTPSLKGNATRLLADPPPVGETWAQIIAGAGTEHSTGEVELRVVYIVGKVYQGFNWYRNLRSILIFNTNLAGRLILGAELRLSTNERSSAFVSTWPTLSAYSASPAAVDDLVDADYSCIDENTKISDEDRTLANGWSSGTVTFPFNAAGLALISAAQYTQIGLLTNCDALGNAPGLYSLLCTSTVIQLQVYYVGEGQYWVEGTSWHFKDASNDEQFFEGTATGNTGVAGHYWVEGDYWHYIDQNGDERRELGSHTGGMASGKIAGHFWVEATTWCYIDTDGDERQI